MGKILSIGARRQLRQQYIFRNHPCLIRQDDDEVNDTAPAGEVPGEEKEADNE